MILLVGLGFRDSALLREEFVRPVGQVVERSGRSWEYMHYSCLAEDRMAEYDAIILCGTALRDTAYQAETARFSWLNQENVPVLGICAGMQVLSLVFSGSLLPCCEIGMEEVRVLSPHPLLPEGPSFMAYELHGYSCIPPEDWVVLAVSKNCIQVISHPDRPLFGVLFHPEARNEEIIGRFLSIAAKME